MADMPQAGSGMRQMYLTGVTASWTASPALSALTDRIGPRGCAANLIYIYRSETVLSFRRGCLFARHSISNQGEDAMKAVFFLSNFYAGPLEGQGLKPGEPGHPWHWLKETDQGWESIPLVAGKPQHFEIAPQAIKHARDHGFEVHYNHPEFKTSFAIKPSRH
jgi:hypothetical protein